MLDRTVERLAALLHGHAFREVPGLVHIGPFQHRRAIGQELDGIAYSIGATKGAHLGIAIPKAKAFDQLVRNWPVRNDANDTAHRCSANLVPRPPQSRSRSGTLGASWT